MIHGNRKRTAVVLVIGLLLVVGVFSQGRRKKPKPTDPAPVVAVDVIPATLTLEIGDAFQLVSVVYDADAQILAEPVVTWAASHDTVLVNNSGVIIAVLAGIVLITATCEGVSGTCTVTVNAVVPPPPSEDHGLTITEDYVATMHDVIPRLAKDGVVIDLNSDWSVLNPPTDAKVIIPAGVTVNYDVSSDTRIAAIEISGTLLFNPAIDTKLYVDDILIMPGGRVIIDYSAGKLCEIIFRGDTQLQTDVDPSQYGKGLIVFGEIKIVGQTKTPFVRLAAAPLAGEIALSLVQPPSSWVLNDILLIPDTRQIRLAGNYSSSSERVFTSQAEESINASVDDTTISLFDALIHDHNGPSNASGDIEVDLFPHVVNLSRNVVIRSEAETPILNRGHVMFLYRAKVDISYTSFVNLGRTLATGDLLHNTEYDSEGNITTLGTNQVGRYSAHFHHCYGPLNETNEGYQYQFVGNVIDGFVKWGITLHDTHFGLLADNVVYGGVSGLSEGWAGSGIATEEGNETGNVIDGNFVCHSRAGSEQRLRASPGEGGTAKQDGIGRDGFWFRGPNNYITNNVATNCADFCFNFNGGVNHDNGVTSVPSIPGFRGADMHDSGSYSAAMTPLLEFSGNEMYGASAQGLWLSHLQGKQQSDNANYDLGPSVFANCRAWHISQACVYDWGDNTGHEFDGWICRGDPSAVDAASFASMGMSFGDTYYRNINTVVRNCDIQGFTIGIELPHRIYLGKVGNPTLIDTCFLKNHINIEDRYPHYTDTRSLVKDVRAELVAAYGGYLFLDLSPVPPTPYHVWMHPNNYDSHAFATNYHRLILQNWQLSGKHYRPYFIEARPDALMHEYRTTRGSLPQNDALCHVNGLTNRQCQDTYGGGLDLNTILTVNKPIGGKLPPCDDSVCTNGVTLAATLGIRGLVFEVTDLDEF